MARIFKRCPCPEDQQDSCPHPWVVRYRTTGGRSSRQREQSFGDDLREAEDFALKVEYDKRAHVFVDPKAGRVLFRDAAEIWLQQHLGADSSIAAYSAQLVADRAAVVRRGRVRGAGDGGARHRQRAEPVGEPAVSRAAAHKGTRIFSCLTSRCGLRRRLPGMTTYCSDRAKTRTPVERRLVFEPIPPGTLQEIRAAGVDEAGNRLTMQTDTHGGNPLRCCLRETVPGEQVLLIAYTPPGTRGAYAERGPVFIHPESCGGYLTPGQYPPALSHRQQVVRGYDRDGRISDGVLVRDGGHAMTVIREMLDRPDVTLVHLRNVGYGCYNFAVRHG